MRTLRNSAVELGKRWLVVALTTCCGLGVAPAWAAEDPEPSPLFRQSLETSVRKMESEGNPPSPVINQGAGRRLVPILPINIPADADTAIRCIYELICMSGNPDTLAMWELEIGVRRAGRECGKGFDCQTHLETDAGSICLIWTYITCAITDLPPIPIDEPSGLNICDCPDYSTMLGSPTCETHTCRSFTCMGTASCSGGGIETMCNLGPTCGGVITCGPEATCGIQATCHELYTTCEGQTCESDPTCEGATTCPWFPTCAHTPTCGTASTCDEVSTCPGSATCAEATCSGATCSGATCPGVFSCSGSPTCATTVTCNGNGDCHLCDCSHQGDMNSNGQLDVADVIMLAHCLFTGIKQPPTDITCSHSSRADIDCDQIHTILDAVGLVDILFNAQSHICDPCTGQLVPVSR